jgi:hypothetical protein
LVIPARRATLRTAVRRLAIRFWLPGTAWFQVRWLLVPCRVPPAAAAKMVSSS